MGGQIDTSYNFWKDTEKGKDPDSHSKTLRRYHRLLWSKPLPCGQVFTLRDDVRGHYLHHSSALGEFSLGSDSIIPTYTRWGFAFEHPELSPPEENDRFYGLAYTIGGFMVFPGNRIGRKWTINQARGCNRSIADRMDLTLECIRRHYSGAASPLAEVLARYGDFFALFGDFRAYVDFFLLHDLLSTDLSSVDFFMPFDDFRPPSTPRDKETYRTFRQKSMLFITARNERIDAFARLHGLGESATATPA